jgi:hypothetical protein
MANAIPTSAKDLILTRDLLAQEYVVVLIDLDDYTYNAAHNDLADVPAGARIAMSGVLANPSVSGGVLDADDPTIAGVTGDQLEAYAVFIRDNAGAGGDSDYLYLTYVDTEPDGSTAITFTPNGSGVTVNMPDGILAL